MYKQHQIKNKNLSKLCSFYITHALNLPHLHGDNITAAEPERGCAGMSLTCNHATLSLYRSPCFLWVSLDPSAALRTVFTCRSEQSSSLFVLKTNFTDTASVSPRGQMLLTWNSSFKNSPLLSSSISSSACVTPVLPQWRKPLSPLALRRSAACPFKAWGIPAVTAGCCPYLGSYEASRRGESLAPVSTNKARTGVT